MTVSETTNDVGGRWLVSPAEAARLLGIGRTKVYELMAGGELRPIHIGRSCRLPVEEVRDYVQRLRDGGLLMPRQRLLGPSASWAESPGDKGTSGGSDSGSAPRTVNAMGGRGKW
jgi:excisionase family DNA binding protein